MTTSRTSTFGRRSVRAAALALVTGVGIALTPSTASADVGAAAPASYAVAPTSAAQIAVDTALAQQGKPYVYGGTGPGGYDCSGLVYSAYRAAGVELPRTSRAQSWTGVPIPWWEIQPGDLLFFYSPVGHVAMAIGNGLMVHSSTYGTPVSVVKATSMPGFVGASRVA